MQRKSRILNRGGFAMVAAVFLLILIASLLLQMLSSTAKSSQQNINTYLSEQAVLLAYGATEHAILAISGSNLNAGCPQVIDSFYPSRANPIFNITTTIRYIWANNTALANNTPAGAGCGNYIRDTAGAQPENELVSAISSGAAIIDVRVVSNNANLQLTENIVFFKRTLQKL